MRFINSSYVIRFSLFVLRLRYTLYVIRYALIVSILQWERFAERFDSFVYLGNHF